MEHLVIALILRLARRPAPYEPSLEAKVLRYGWLVRSIALLGALLLLACVAQVLLTSGIRVWRASPHIIVAVLVITALEVGFAVETLGVRILLTDRAIIGYSPWRFPRAIDWEEIVDVSYSAAAMWFVIQGARGEKIRVHLMVSGVSSLVHEIRARLAVSVYEKALPGFAVLDL
jgi:hypothetical protein